jgi:hypothetical protein
MITPEQDLKKTEEELKAINFVLSLLELKRDSLRKKRELLIKGKNREAGRGGA